jgi:hypothetical protein
VKNSWWEWQLVTYPVRQVRAWLLDAHVRGHLQIGHAAHRAILSAVLRCTVRRAQKRRTHSQCV